MLSSKVLARRLLWKGLVTKFLKGGGCEKGNRNRGFVGNPAGDLDFPRTGDSGAEGKDRGSTGEAASKPGSIVKAIMHP